MRSSAAPISTTPTRPTRAETAPESPQSTTTRSLIDALTFPFVAGWTKRELITDLARRRLATRYRESVLGTLWILLIPLILLLVYTFVFGVVLEARWGTSSDEVGSYAEFAVRLFAGLLVYGFFRECLQAAPKLIRSNATLVNKVVFPLEVLPWVVLLEAAVGLLAGLAILAGFVLAVEGVPPLTALAVPLLILPLVPVCLAVVYFVSAIGVFLRDVDQVVAVLAGVLLFLSPVFYPIERVPEPFRTIVRGNPMTEIISWVRGALFEGVLPGVLPVLGYLGVACLLCAGAAWFFMRARRAFADVL